jgi:hypothetical protein
MIDFTLDKGYQHFLITMKEQYRAAQLKVVYAVNTEMIQFYWQLGKQLT